jgi:hypothetical protein
VSTDPICPDRTGQVDCSGCIGQVHRHGDVWLHEDDNALCYSAAPNLGWPAGGGNRPAGYEQRAAAYARIGVPAVTG